MKIKITLLLVAAAAIVSSLVTYYFCNQDLKSRAKTEDVISSPGHDVHSTSNFCSYKIGRLKGFKFIRPLEYAEPECEGSKFISLKVQIQNEIVKYKNSNGLINASVYLRDFDKANWMDVNPSEKYHPASLLKLAVLITFLKMEEKAPIGAFIDLIKGTLFMVNNSLFANLVFFSNKSKKFSSYKDQNVPLSHKY